MRDHPDVDSSGIQAAFDDVFDQVVVFHGFADYVRDYEVFIYTAADLRTGIRPEQLRYRFTHCVRATVTSALSTETWKRSLDERLIDYEQGRGLDAVGSVAMRSDRREWRQLRRGAGIGVSRSRSAWRGRRCWWREG